ncbi:hypothetical protein SUGI_1159320 [Cryptomeria japonica]|nr:hypothetical protein SUGI_1159320 [Cryptomeria japonica]
MDKSKDGTNLKDVHFLTKTKFRIVEDDSKPVLKDPLLRADPIETEQAVLQLPPFDPRPKRYSGEMDVSSD